MKETRTARLVSLVTQWTNDGISKKIAKKPLNQRPARQDQKVRPKWIPQVVEVDFEYGVFCAYGPHQHGSLPQQAPGQGSQTSEKEEYVAILLCPEIKATIVLPQDQGSAACTQNRGNLRCPARDRCQTCWPLFGWTESSAIWSLQVTVSVLMNKSSNSKDWNTR